MSVDSTVIQSDTISAAQDGWSVPVTFQQFDPNSGTLTGVDLGMNGTITGIEAIENLGTTAATDRVATGGTIALNAGSVVVDTAGPSASGFVTLGAYDGTTDFAGISGTIATIVGTAVGTLTNATGSLSSYVGTGTVGWTATSQASLSLASDGNIASVTRSETGADISLQYIANGPTSSAPFYSDAVVTYNYDPVLPLSFFGSETTAPQLLRVADVQTGGTSAVVANQFDPSLGTLDAVVLTVYGTVDSGLALENLGSVAGTGTVTEYGNFTLLANGGTVDGTTVTVTASVSLGTYDGTLDFAGTSGTNVNGLSGIASATNELTSGLSDFIGTGATTLDLATSSNAYLNGPADLAYQELTNAGAIVEVSYIYQPASSAVAAPSLAITGATAGQTDIQTDAINPFLGVTISDPISSELDTLVITESNMNNGTLVHLASNGIVDSTSGTNGVYTTTVTADELNSFVLSNLWFHPTSGTILPGQSIVTGFTIEVIAPGGSVVTDTTTSVIQVPGLGIDTTSAAAAAEAVLAQETVAQTPTVTQNDTVACFAAGTRIATPTGPIPIEDLNQGDQVLTVTGQSRKIVWIGRRTIDLHRHNDPDRVRPIRIAPHAVGPDRPSRTLHLSPDHAIYTDDVLIPVKHLINDETIVQANPATITYYHLELSTHDVILAENLPCETFLETGNRTAFDNGPVTDLHPDFQPRHGDIWDTLAYAPLCLRGEVLHRVQARLRSQAATARPRLRRSTKR